MTILLIVLGLVLLFAGGELLVRGAVRLAQALGMSSLVIGLAVVGFGTSTPELVTSVEAAILGSPGIAIGNIVGSNIANALLIVGVAAAVYPIGISSMALKRDSVVMIGVTIAFLVISLLIPLDRVVGVAFLAVLVVYIALVIRFERQANSVNHGAIYDKAKAFEETDPGLSPAVSAKTPLGLAVAMSLAGLALLIGGGKLLVVNAVALAQQLGVSDSIIGLTIVAVGTSLPELVTSLVAAIRKEADVAYGNVVGSNIYNLLGIGGFTAVVNPIDVPPQIATFDNPVMLAAALVLILFAWTGYRIRRREGIALLAGYAAYVYLIWP